MKIRPTPLIALGLVVLGSIFVSVSDGAIARGIRHAGFGAALAVVPDESKIAAELRSLINRTRLAATEEDKASEDAARLAAIEESQPDVLKSLSTQLGRDVSWVTARRLEQLNNSSSEIPRSLVLDRGQVQGVGVQALAFTPDGLAGIVVLAEDQKSTVLLLTDQQCQISAQVPGAGKTGMLCGLAPDSSKEDGPLLLLKYLSRYANPEPGTEVLSSGIGGLYPANLLLGSVVSYKAGDLHGEALVRPAVKFAELETLLLTRASQL